MRVWRYFKEKATSSSMASWSAIVNPLPNWWITAWRLEDADAAELALTAGVDMEMISQTYHDTLKQQQSRMSPKVLDEAAAYCG